MNELKENSNKFLNLVSLEFVQDLFDMQDVNKWLKFNATSEIQVRRAERVEENIQNLLKKLCVPNY